MICPIFNICGSHRAALRALWGGVRVVRLLKLLRNFKELWGEEGGLGALGGRGGGIGGCGFWLWFFIIYAIIELIIKL